jgi:hypothetical protein
MSDKFYFRCTSNPTAPFLVLDSAWEAEEMKSHPDYERVTAAGEVILDPMNTAPLRIPFSPPKREEPAKPAKRATLKMPNRKVKAE